MYTRKTDPFTIRFNQHRGLKPSNFVSIEVKLSYSRLYTEQRPFCFQLFDYLIEPSYLWLVKFNYIRLSLCRKNNLADNQSKLVFCVFSAQCNVTAKLSNQCSRIEIFTVVVQRNKNSRIQVELLNGSCPGITVTDKYTK